MAIPEDRNPFGQQKLHPAYLYSFSELRFARWSEIDFELLDVDDPRENPCTALSILIAAQDASPHLVRIQAQAQRITSR